ncbi:CotH kinase family protein [Chloroflexota bacterium]
MRIRHAEESANGSRRFGNRERFRAGQGSSRVLLLAVLVTASIIVIGVWMTLEGYRILSRPFSDLLEPTVVESQALPALHLELEDKAYQALAAYREAAFREGSIAPDARDWVEARFRFGSESVPAHLRLAGDSAAHWRQEKWSYQARTQGDGTVMGMRQFSLQSPATVGLLNGWLYGKAMRREGILAPRFTFVRLIMNDADWGVYALVEGLSEEMLEAQGRGGGILARFEREPSGQTANLSDEVWDVDPDPVVTSSHELADGDPGLAEQGRTALQLLRAFQRQQLAPSEVFDAQIMGRYLAHVNLWGARYGLELRNQHYYFDPSTLWIEPIASDGHPLSGEDAARFDLAQYDDLSIMEAYAQEALVITRPEYLEGLQRAYGESLDRLRATLLREFDPVDLNPPWISLAERQAEFSAALRPARPVHAYLGSKLPVADDPDGTVDLLVASLAKFPLVVRQVRSGDRAVEVQSDWVPEADVDKLYEQAIPSLVLRPSAGDAPRYITLQLPTHAIEQLRPSGSASISGTLQVVAHVVGVDEWMQVEVQEDVPSPAEAPVTPTQPTIEEALERYPFLEPADEPGYLELKPGTWQVEGDLVLPDGIGLLALQPSTLEFDPSAVLFSTGPLVLRGPIDEGIGLVPKEDHWAGLFVRTAEPERASELHNVEILATSGVHRAGWSSKAGATFDGSPVALKGCRLSDSVAKTALHIVGTSFELEDTEFDAIFGDAFVGDTVRGSVRQTSFRDVLGTAIDLTDSDAVMEDVRLLRTLGTGIRAGQGSTVVAEGTRAENVAIAIVSTDGSRVEALDTSIAQAWTAGFAAYTTGPEQRPASIVADGVMFQDQLSPVTLVQRGCSVTIDGVEAAASEPVAYGRSPGLEAQPTAHAVNYSFGSALRLAGYSLRNGSLVPGDILRLDLYWQAVEQPDRDYTIFVHVLDESGQTVAQRDTMPRDNTLPTSRWPLGEVIDDTILVPLPPDSPAGKYSVALGIYYWETLEKLPVAGPGGESLPDGVLILDEAIQVGE